MVILNSYFKLREKSGLKVLVSITIILTSLVFSDLFWEELIDTFCILDFNFYTAIPSFYLR